MQSYRLHIVLKDGTEKFSSDLGDLEFVDRLANECLRDPLVASATAVQKADETDLCVRARVAGDLDTFRRKYCPALSPTVESLGTDYRFRAWANKRDLAQAVAKVAMNIDYANFKDRVADVHGLERAHAYGDVWGVMRQLQVEPREPVAKSRKRRRKLVE